MKRVYLLLAVLGAVFPYLFFGQFFVAHGVNLGGFLSAATANGAVRGFTADLVVSSLVFWIAMFQSRKQGKGPNPIPFIALNLLIGLSCALPAYLYVKEGNAA